MFACNQFCHTIAREDAPKHSAMKRFYLAFALVTLRGGGCGCNIASDAG